MKPPPSRLAQLRDDLTLALVLLVLGTLLTVVSFLPHPRTPSTKYPSSPSVSPTP